MRRHRGGNWNQAPSERGPWDERIAPPSIALWTWKQGKWLKRSTPLTNLSQYQKTPVQKIQQTRGVQDHTNLLHRGLSKPYLHRTYQEVRTSSYPLDKYTNDITHPARQSSSVFFVSNTTLKYAPNTKPTPPTFGALPWDALFLYVQKAWPKPIACFG